MLSFSVVLNIPLCSFSNLIVSGCMALAACWIRSNLSQILNCPRADESTTMFSGFSACYSLSPNDLGASPICLRLTLTYSFLRDSISLGMLRFSLNGFAVGLMTGINPRCFAVSYAVTTDLGGCTASLVIWTSLGVTLSVLPVLST